MHMIANTIYNMHWFLLPLIIIFCFSCAKAAPLYPEKPLQASVAYAQWETSHHTKHIHKQQRDICNRLKNIQKRIEKTKTKKKAK